MATPVTPPVAPGTGTTSAVPKSPVATTAIPGTIAQPVVKTPVATNPVTQKITPTPPARQPVIPVVTPKPIVPPVESKKLYNVRNITSEKTPPGFIVSLTRGQIDPGEEGIATLAEVQNLGDFIKVVD